MTPRLKPLILHRKLGLTEAAVTLPEQTLTLSRDAARVDLPRAFPRRPQNPVGGGGGGWGGTGGGWGSRIPRKWHSARIA